VSTTTSTRFFAEAYPAVSQWSPTGVKRRSSTFTDPMPLGARTEAAVSCGTWFPLGDATRYLEVGVPRLRRRHNAHVGDAGLDPRRDGLNAAEVEVQVSHPRVDAQLSGTSGLKASRMSPAAKLGKSC